LATTRYEIRKKVRILLYSWLRTGTHHKNLVIWKPFFKKIWQVAEHGPEHGPHSHNACPQGLYTGKTAEAVTHTHTHTHIIINPHDTLWVPTGYHRGKK